MQNAKRKTQNGLAWRRPERHVDLVTGFTWRRWLSRCGTYRVSVRVDGPAPFRFYAERRADQGGVKLWRSVIAVAGCVAVFRAKQAAVRVCEVHARRNVPPAAAAHKKEASC